MAWSLKTLCDQLGTGEFLAAMAGGSVSPTAFPALLFLAACFTSFAIGTSWGTMAILIPTTVPIAVTLNAGSYGIVVFLSLATILDGAIFGDCCSPISDTTIMSSIASQCNRINHVNTQMPYSVCVGILAVVCGYLPAAMGVQSW